MKYHTYILYSKDIDHFHIGHTGDTLEERLGKHFSDHKGFTGKAKDWNYFYAKRYVTKKEAYHRELEIKRKKSRRFIERLEYGSAG